MVREGDARPRCILPPYVPVIPMAMVEFLCLTITRAVIPGMQTEVFGKDSYKIEGLTLASQGILSFLFCPLIGSLSDKHGRCIPLAVCIAGVLPPVFSVMCGYHLMYYQILMGLSGMFKGSLVIVLAYVADVTVSGGSRTKAFGMVFGSLGFCLTVGPYLGSRVSEYYGVMASFYLTAALGISGCLYSLFILPEPKRSTDDPPQSPNPMKVLSWVCCDAYLRKLMTIAFLYYVTYWGLVSSIMLFLTRKFNYGIAERGRFLSLIGFCHMLSEAFLVRVLVSFGIRDKTLVTLGIFAWGVKLVIFGLATDRVALDFGILTSLVAGLFGPSLFSVASTAAETRGKQGEVQGAIAAFRGLAEGVGPVLVGTLFTVYENTLDSVPYLALSFIAFACVPLAMNLSDPEKYRTTPVMPTIEVHDLDFSERDSLCIRDC